MAIKLRSNVLKARGRRVPVKVYVGREASSTRFGNEVFTGCVVLGNRVVPKHKAICAPGKSPHAAIGAAMEKAGRIVKKRRSAFSGKRRR